MANESNSRNQSHILSTAIVSSCSIFSNDIFIQLNYYQKFISEGKTLPRSTYWSSRLLIGKRTMLDPTCLTARKLWSKLAVPHKSIFEDILKI